MVKDKKPTKIKKEKSMVTLIDEIMKDRASWISEKYESKPGFEYFRFRNNKTKKIKYIGNKLRFDVVMEKLKEKE